MYYIHVNTVVAQQLNTTFGIKAKWGFSLIDRMNTNVSYLLELAKSVVL